MKNIHVLPTNKPSRLCLDSKDKLWFAKNSGYTIADGKVNIYITSDEEIKEDDYRMNIQRGYFKKSDKEGLDYYNKRNDVFKKIILTTDQDLIKDGVQAIDDEFLEWFVNNPNCEKVEVVSAKTIPALQLTGNGHCWWKIIIPKEEPKQETIEKDPCNFCGKTLREQMKGCNEITCYRQFLNKQETLEEAAESYVKDSSHELYQLRKQCFMDGAKWQQKRMYSEEDMINFSEWVSIQYPNQRRFLTTNDKIGFYTTKELLGKWFEQFKK